MLAFFVSELAYKVIVRLDFLFNQSVHIGDTAR